MITKQIKKHNSHAIFSLAIKHPITSLSIVHELYFFFRYRTFYSAAHSWTRAQVSIIGLHPTARATFFY